jgi:hypothetical protein
MAYKKNDMRMTTSIAAHNEPVHTASNGKNVKKYDGACEASRTKQHLQ